MSANDASNLRTECAPAASAANATGAADGGLPDERPSADAGAPAEGHTPGVVFSAVRPRRRLFCFLLFVLLGFSLGCSEFVIIGIEPELANNYHTTIARIGDLISLFALSYAIATPLLSIFTSNVRRSTILAIYLVIFVVSNLVSAATAPTFEILLASRIVMGAVSGPLLAVATTYVPDLLGIARSSIGISIIYAAFSIALVLASSAGRFIVEFLNWHVAMDAAFVFALVSAVLLVIFVPREPAPKKHRNKAANSADATGAKGKLASNANAAGVSSKPANVPASSTRTLHDQISLLKEPTIILGVLLFTFGVGAVYTFYGYVAPYLETYLGFQPTQSGVILLVFGLICIVSDLLSGVIDLRFGMKPIPGVLLAIGVALLALWLCGSNGSLALVPIFAIALLMYSFSISCISMFMGVARTKHPRALVLAASLEPTSFNIGIAFGTMVGGLVVSHAGLGSVGLMGAVLGLLASLCALGAIFFWKRIQKSADATVSD